MSQPQPLTIYATCPPSNLRPQAGYRDAVLETARRCEEHGCTGALIYTDNGLVDPWHLAHDILANTKQLRPLVAVQPIYMHPYWLAKQIATLAHLFERPVDLNLLAGGFIGDLRALGDTTPHDERYQRTIEYADIVNTLLRGEKATKNGRYYQVDQLALAPALPEALRPRLLISGSSPAGRAAAASIQATAVCYPKPPGEYTAEPPPSDVPIGLRVGIIARDHSDDAWQLAHDRFPEDRRGQIAHQMAMKVSDSTWHRQISDLGTADRTYWLVPFENYKTFCPYLVGSYDEVAVVLAEYLRLGFATIILDVPRDDADLEHSGEALRRAQQLAFG